MSGATARDMPTSTAATAKTEPAVIAAISSARGRTMVSATGRRTAGLRLTLLGAAAALGTLTAWWAWHVADRRAR
jgi:hypothetical protein